MGDEIRHLHHVGLVVNDMERALELYRRLGFDLSPPSYPIISQKEGDPPRPFGAANTHANFLRNFIEIATVVSDDSRIPDGAHLVPLQVPPAVLPRILETIKRTVGTLAACLSRFEGLHILVFETPDVGASAAQLDRDGVRHSGPNTLQRQIETARGVEMAPVHFLEIDGEHVPEGRLALAENPDPELMHTQSHMDHPNGAFDLLETVLCAADGDVDEVLRRYRKYLGRHPRPNGEAHRFELENGCVTVVPASALATLFPGELAPPLPAVLAFAVAVRELKATRKLLEGNGVPLAVTPTGDLFVPATAAAGAAVIFRQPR